MALSGTAVIASGCGSSSKGGGQASASAKQTITVWLRNDETGATGPLAKAFEASHPNITVKESVIPGPTFATKLATAISSGSAPDVVSLNDIETPYFASHGTLADITSKVNALSFKSALAPGMLTLSQVKGQYYGVPNDGGYSVMMYNKGLFKKAGLNPNDPPKTWAQILSDARAITKLGHGDYGFSFAGNCPGCYAFTELPFIWASGGNVVNATGTKATVSTSAPVTGLLTLLHTMVAEKLVPPSDETDTGATWGNDFVAGTVGMLPQAPQLATAAQQKGVDVGVAPIPGMNGGKATFAGGDNWVIPNASNHQAAAWAFIKWNLSEQAQDILAKYAISPVRSDIVTPAFKKKYPFLAVALQTLPEGKAPYLTNYDAIFNDASGPFLSMMVQGIFKGQISSAIKSGQAGFTSVLEQK